MNLRKITFLAALTCLTAGSNAATMPAGNYGCYTYNPKAIYVGEISIAGARYAVARFGTSGEYEFDSKSGEVTWRGTPPMGFEAATMETDRTTGKPILRMYPKAQDVGNKWKAAVCSPKNDSATGGVTPGTSAGGAGKGASTGAAAGTSSGTSAGAAFKPGDKVTAEFIGVPYPATVLAAEATRVRLKYDDPKSKDEWVDVNRIKLRK